MVSRNKVLTVVGFLAGVTAGTVLALSVARAQTVPCWYVPNGSYVTLQCANGYWQTIDGDNGLVYTGNGRTDPSANAQGSGIVINPSTGGPFVGAGPTVTAPAPLLPLLEPYQAETYGFQPRQD